MEKKTVIIIVVTVFLVVAAAVVLTAIIVFTKDSSTQENQKIRQEKLQNGSHILKGELCPCHSICINGYTCHTRTGCYNQHAAANTLENLVMINCSAAEGYVCCPPVPRRNMIKIRDPELNKQLLPIDDCGVFSPPRIIGGQEAGLGQFPWMALLAYRSNASASGIEYICGGTLISTRYILTAAHCINAKGFGNPVHVRLGELDLSMEKDCVEDLYCSDPPVDVEIEKIIAHEDYNNPFLKNDIALLRLKTTVNLTQFTLPICLPFNLNITGEEETKYNVAGWGKNGNQNVKGTEALLFAHVHSVPVSECDEVMPKEVRPVNELQLCAGGNGENDACKGDSGGPMMKNVADNIIGATTTYQIGIVSFGAEKCGTEVPSVYTRVSSYLRWILTNLEP